MTSSYSYLTDYGVSKEFEAEELYRTGLDKRFPYSEQVLNNDEILNLIKLKTKKDSFSIAGWIDQAVLEIKTNELTLEKSLEIVNIYRPDQGGDIGIYQKNNKEIFEIGFSEEIGRLWVTLYSQP